MNFNFPDNITLTDEVQFHLLRHFSSVDNDFYKTFHFKSGIKVSHIKQQLELSGSKFFPHFASNPNELLKKIRKMIKEEKFKYRHLKNKFEITITFSKKNYPQGIGTDNIIAYSKLTSAEKAKVVIKKRENTDVMLLKKSLVQPTWSVQVILLKDDHEINIISVFPGKLCPPLPNPETQVKKEFNANRRFWEKHVFIVIHETG